MDIAVCVFILKFTFLDRFPVHVDLSFSFNFDN